MKSLYWIISNGGKDELVLINEIRNERVGLYNSSIPSLRRQILRLIKIIACRKYKFLSFILYV